MCAFSSDAGQGSPLEWRFSSALRESSRRSAGETQVHSSVQTGTRRRQGAVSSQRQSLRERASRTEGDGRDEEKNREQEQDRKASCASVRECSLHAILSFCEFQGRGFVFPSPFDSLAVPCETGCGAQRGMPAFDPWALPGFSCRE